MKLKVRLERDLLSPAEIDVLSQLAVRGRPKRIAEGGTRTLFTLKTHFHTIYSKIEDFNGQRPYLGNVLLFAIFGRFLTEEEARYLIESGELHDWTDVGG